jgi:hypothetical protein
MNRVPWTAPAVSDLESIREIARDSEVYADSVLSEILMRSTNVLPVRNPDGLSRSRTNRNPLFNSNQAGAVFAHGSTRIFSNGRFLNSCSFEYSWAILSFVCLVCFVVKFLVAALPRQEFPYPVNLTVCAFPRKQYGAGRSPQADDRKPYGCQPASQTGNHDSLVCRTRPKCHLFCRFKPDK